MNMDTVISWLIHSDWYLLGAWVVLLGAAVVMGFTDLSARLLKPGDGINRELPPF
jgi:hypothetical protein